MSRPVMIDALSRMAAAGLALFAGSSLATVTSQLTQLGSTTVAAEKANEPDRMGEIVSAYGFSPAASRDKPYAFNDGVAVIPVHGMLLNRFSYGFGFVTGYQYIRGLANAAADDPDVTLIVYDINSYGGEAAGCFELAADLAEISTRKPTLAMVDSAACSAAYAVACVQRKIVAAPSATVGSIGVIATHIDISDALTQAGVKITLIAEGPQKTQGSPYEPLSDAARADMTERVNQRYDLFVALVAEARGSKGLDDAAIRGTESRSYLAQQALDLKLIDAVQTPSEAVSSFLAELGDDDPSSGSDEPEDEEMAAKTEAEQAQEVAAARADGVKEGAKAEGKRINDIMSLPAAQKRPALAKKLAGKEGMSAEDAKDILEAAAEETAPAKDDKGGDDKGGKGGDDKNGKGGDEKDGKGSGDDAGAGGFRGAMDQAGGAGVSPNSGDGQGGDAGQPNRAQRALASAFGPGKRR